MATKGRSRLDDLRKYSPGDEEDQRAEPEHDDDDQSVIDEATMAAEKEEKAEAERMKTFFTHVRWRVLC